MIFKRFGIYNTSFQRLLKVIYILRGVIQENNNRRSTTTTTMLEVILNDRLGKKIRVKCNKDDTIGDLKKLVAAQTGTRPEKIRIQKWYTIYKDHITLEDYEIHDGMGLELYYN